MKIRNVQFPPAFKTMAVKWKLMQVQCFMSSVQLCLKYLLLQAVLEYSDLSSLQEYNSHYVPSMVRAGTNKVQCDVSMQF